MSPGNFEIMPNFIFATNLNDMAFVFYCHIFSSVAACRTQAPWEGPDARLLLAGGQVTCRERSVSGSAVGAWARVLLRIPPAEGKRDLYWLLTLGSSRVVLASGWGGAPQCPAMFSGPISSFSSPWLCFPCDCLRIRWSHCPGGSGWKASPGLRNLGLSLESRVLP